MAGRRLARLIHGGSEDSGTGLSSGSARHRVTLCTPGHVKPGRRVHARGTLSEPASRTGPARGSQESALGRRSVQGLAHSKGPAHQTVLLSASSQVVAATGTPEGGLGSHSTQHHQGGQRASTRASRTKGGTWSTWMEGARLSLSDGRTGSGHAHSVPFPTSGRLSESSTSTKTPRRGKRKNRTPLLQRGLYRCHNLPSSS